MYGVRAVRGAVQVDRDDPTTIFAATEALLLGIVSRNDLAADDLISVLFTMTPDLNSCFPAEAARALGLVDVPMLCATEIGVPNAMQRVIRLLAHVQTNRPQRAIEHVYLGDAAKLRPDLQRRRNGHAPAQPAPPPPKTGSTSTWLS